MTKQILSLGDKGLALLLERVLYSGLPTVEAVDRLYQIVVNSDFTLDERLLIVRCLCAMISQDLFAIKIWQDTSKFTAIQEIVDGWDETWLQLLNEKAVEVYLGNNPLVQNAIRLMT